MNAVLTSLLTLSSGLVCPVSGEPIPADAKAFDANGIRYRFCCSGCIDEFKKDPSGALAKAARQKWVVGTFIFDPVSGRRLTPQNARGGVSDWEGVRFGFQSAANKSTFDSDPKRYGATPSKSSLACPIMNVEISASYLAPGYADSGGVRFFACCEQCLPKMRSAFAPTAEQLASAGTPKVFAVPDAWTKLTGPFGG